MHTWSTRYQGQDVGCLRGIGAALGGVHSTQRQPLSVHEYTKSSCTHDVWRWFSFNLEGADAACSTDTTESAGAPTQLSSWHSLAAVTTMTIHMRACSTRQQEEGSKRQEQQLFSSNQQHTPGCLCWTSYLMVHTHLEARSSRPQRPAWPQARARR